MNKLLAAKIQLVAATAIVLALAIALGAVVVARPPAAPVVSDDVGGVAATQPAVVSISHALHDDRPMVIVFRPMEQCAIQYCLTAEVVAQRFVNRDVNIVEAPVYAVSREGRTDDHIYPIIDWGVYLVEPFVNWLPEFAEGEFGYGLGATALALVDADGQVVARHQGFAALDGFMQEALAYLDGERNPDSASAVKNAPSS